MLYNILSLSHCPPRAPPLALSLSLFLSHCPSRALPRVLPQAVSLASSLSHYPTRALHLALFLASSHAVPLTLSFTMSFALSLLCCPLMLSLSRYLSCAVPLAGLSGSDMANRTMPLFGSCLAGFRSLTCLFGSCSASLL